MFSYSSSGKCSFFTHGHTWRDHYKRTRACKDAIIRPTSPKSYLPEVLKASLDDTRRGYDFDILRLTRRGMFLISSQFWRIGKDFHIVDSELAIILFGACVDLEPPREELTVRMHDYRGTTNEYWHKPKGFSPNFPWIINPCSNSKASSFELHIKWTYAHPCVIFLYAFKKKS